MTVLDEIYTALTGCRRIVRAIPGDRLVGVGDIYQCADGSVWERVERGYNGSPHAVMAYLNGSFVCAHHAGN